MTRGQTRHVSCDKRHISEIIGINTDSKACFAGMFEKKVASKNRIGCVFLKESINLWTG